MGGIMGEMQLAILGGFLPPLLTSCKLDCLLGEQKEVYCGFYYFILVKRTIYHDLF